MAVSRILSIRRGGLDDHLSHPDFSECPATITEVIDRRYSNRDATLPEDRRTGCPPSVLSCTAWGFSCLANHSASGELLPHLFTLTCSKNRRLFSVTLSVTPTSRSKRPRVLRGMPPYGVRTFLQRISRFTSDHLPSNNMVTQDRATRIRYAKHPKQQTQTAQAEGRACLVPLICPGPQVEQMGRDKLVPPSTPRRL
jgi:hypothetical protein